MKAGPPFAERTLADLLNAFADIDTNPEHRYLQSTIERDVQVQDHEAALLEFYSLFGQLLPAAEGGAA